MGKKFLSVLLSLALLVTIAPAAGIAAYADEQTKDYALADTTADGVILHAFNWSYNTIKDNLPAIAAAGYTTVQTSPVQQPKNFCDSRDTSGQWWKLYQPLSFSVGEQSWLGTKADLTALCKEAEKYGVKIICDIVSNHMANDEEGNPYTYYEGIKDYEPEIYSNTDKYFHQVKRNVDDSKLQYLLQGTLDGVPDLNTGDEYIQERVISLLKECIDCGVDGFRFDAAKHIETPSDGDYASDFWPNVIGAASDYSKQVTGNDIFCYGEILNSPGSGRSVTYYTPYINVTDNKAGDATLVNVIKANAERIVTVQGYSYSDAEPSNLVLWAESHDTYMGQSGSAGLSNTADVSNEDIAKAWAIIAARSKSTSLYLARPGVIMGEAGDSAWRSTAVSEVNKFHNKFVGTDDSVYSDGKVVAVQRGTSGIVLVNLDGKNSSVNVATQGMTDGTYLDAVTGTEFKVVNGTISGTIGSTGIAVVYEGAETTPKANFSKEDTRFKTDTVNVTVTLENSVSGTYSINGADAVEFTGSVSLTLGEGAQVGDVISLKVTATDGKQTVEEIHYYTKEAGSGTGVFVYFDNSVRKFKDVCVYAFYEQKDSSGEVIYSTSNGTWPGVIMDFDESKNIYFYELPADLKVGEARIIFSDGGSNQTSQKGHEMKYQKMIYKDNKWQEYVDGKKTLIYGDINDDKNVTAVDSLLIQRIMLKLIPSNDESYIVGDVDGDGRLTLNDAIEVQRYAVGYEPASGSKVGKEFVYGGEDNTDTDSDTDSTFDTDLPVDSDTDSDTDTDSGNRFYAVDSTGWIFDYGAKLWVVNNETEEAIEMIKESPEDDSSKYSYVTLPEGWVDLSLYRTDPYDTDISAAYNSWNCGKITDSYNAYKMTGDGTGSYISYDPNAAAKYIPKTIYFDNSVSKWSTVYIHGWGVSGLGDAYIEMDLVEGTDNIYTYTFEDDIEVGVKTFLFTEGEDKMGRKGKQTVDVAGEDGKDLFKCTTLSSDKKYQYEWAVYEK